MYFWAWNLIEVARSTDIDELSEVSCTDYSNLVVLRWAVDVRTGRAQLFPCVTELRWDGDTIEAFQLIT